MKNPITSGSNSGDHCQVIYLGLFAKIIKHYNQ